MKRFFLSLLCVAMTVNLLAIDGALPGVFTINGFKYASQRATCSIRQARIRGGLPINNGKLLVKPTKTFRRPMLAGLTSLAGEPAAITIIIPT